jgi:hypothetical protein
MTETERKDGGKCSTCGRPMEPRYRPFCSQRCQQVDLGRWFGENYRIAAGSRPDASPDGANDDLD